MSFMDFTFDELILQLCKILSGNFTSRIAAGVITSLVSLINLKVFH